MALTTAEQIAAVEAAIARAESAQSREIDGMAITAPNLSQLYKRLDRLKSTSARASGSRPMFRGISFESMSYD